MRGGTMAFFKWKDSFNIGNDTIDKQHRSLLECLNDCYLGVSTGKQSEIDPGLIKRLKTYADTHFRYEESLLQTKGDPKLGDHEKQHKFFESQLAEFEQANKAKAGKAPESVLVFLRDWFLKHILEEDKKIFSYLK
jgi:hemerythrin